VHLTDLDSDEESSYQIVGEDEADIKGGLLSVASPIARALIGKHEGDTVEVTTPGGRKTYEITEVQYV
jgi:transcription elongation factor GreA